MHTDTHYCCNLLRSRQTFGFLLDIRVVKMGLAMAFVDGEYYAESDVTDTEEEYEFTPRAFERRGSKRTYGGVPVDGAGERSRKRSRVDEQIELLRAAIPNLRTNEKASILAGAYEYIEKLQRQVLALHDELEGSCSDDDDDDDESSCEDGDEEAAARDECSCACSVEVVRTDQGLRVHVQCERRTHVLADIMDLLESSGMSVEQVSIAYEEDSQFVFDCLGSEVDGRARADRKLVETRLKSLVADRRE